MKAVLIFCCLVVLAGCAPRYQVTSDSGIAWKLDTKTGDLWWCEIAMKPACYKADYGDVWEK
jgi:hypothetical protein